MNSEISDIMKALIFLLFGCYLASSAQGECDPGWIPYKSDICIKAFNEQLTFDEAKNFCTSQGNVDNTATLAMVKDAELQELLVSYTQDTSENFWLGARFYNASAQVNWVDGDILTYTNWVEGYPKNLTGSEFCVEFVSGTENSSANLRGRWKDVPCQNRNLPLCQRTESFTLEAAKKAIQKLERELEAVSSRVVPIGSIYIEYYNQPSPVSLWPTLKWEDVSSSYAGLFFRAEGGGAEIWGTTQADCAPQITQIQRGKPVPYHEYVDNPLVLPLEGWSSYGQAGLSRDPESNAYHYDVLRYNVQKCEVVPKNQAIRIWKRLA